jgi:hypothetical protein
MRRLALEGVDDESSVAGLFPEVGVVVFVRALALPFEVTRGVAVERCEGMAATNLLRLAQGILGTSYACPEQSLRFYPTRRQSSATHWFCLCNAEMPR